MGFTALGLSGGELRQPAGEWRLALSLQIPIGDMNNAARNMVCGRNRLSDEVYKGTTTNRCGSAVRAACHRK